MGFPSFGLGVSERARQRAALAVRESGGIRENALGYLIAAYGIVIGSLVAYALWINNQRRKLKGQGERESE